MLCEGQSSSSTDAVELGGTSNDGSLAGEVLFRAHGECFSFCEVIEVVECYRGNQVVGLNCDGEKVSCPGN